MCRLVDLMHFASSIVPAKLTMRRSVWCGDPGGDPSGCSIRANGVGAMKVQHPGVTGQTEKRLRNAPAAISASAAMPVRQCQPNSKQGRLVAPCDRRVASGRLDVMEQLMGYKNLAALPAPATARPSGLRSGIEQRDAA